MTDQAFTVSEVADKIGISAPTVRRWCREYATYLSPGANPEMGGSRVFSSDDLEVFREVSRLRGEKLSPAVINQRLGEMVFHSMPVVTSPQQALEGPAQTETALAVVSAVQSALAPYEAVQQAQEARLQALEAQRPTWRDTIIIGLACLFVGAMIGLSIWMFQ